MENETIQEDVLEPTALEPSDDATGLFMKSFETSDEGASDNDGDETPDTEDDETSEEEVGETEETDEDETTEDADPDEDGDQVADDEDQEEDDGEAEAIDDTAEVTFMVNGEEHTKSVGELKRLAGQEQALTQKSQQLAEKTKQHEALSQATTAVLERLVEDAKNTLDQYEKLDWRAAARGLSDQEYTQLEAEYKEARERFSFMEQELQATSLQNQQAQQERMQQEAQAAVQELTDPAMPTYIADWSEKTYGDITSYMVKQGMSQEAASQETNPAVISAFYKAMKSDQAEVKAKQTIKKAKITPKKVAKTTKRQAKKVKSNRRTAAIQKMKDNPQGGQDLATDAFMASFED